MTRIQAVIFDIGGVLVRRADPVPLRTWERRLALPEGELGEIVYTNPISQQATVGNATPDQAWAYIGRYLGLSPDDTEALRADFGRGMAWDTDLLDFVRSLRPQLKTATISDAWSDAREMVRPYVNEDTFDVIVLSAEEGIKKPDSEIYRRALLRLDVAPQSAVFVDDRQPNVEGACRIGMRAFLYTGSRQARQEIERLLAEQNA